MSEACHGNGVVQTPEFAFTIEKGFSQIRPNPGGALTGDLHFPVARPPYGYNRVTVVSVNFSSQSGYVEGWEIWLGSQQIAEKKNLHWTGTDSTVLVTVCDVTEQLGLDVVLNIAFDNPTGSMRISSVNLKYT
ncbi:hypothetical protein ABW19_dt0209560 [Dactylella cylindrospora]|nr:hypothetical protein ABW19_dt0209560 [Dactylella cylindrospora]